MTASRLRCFKIVVRNINNMLLAKREGKNISE